jgi:broad specificity phosphatase PhoE
MRLQRFVIVLAALATSAGVAFAQPSTIILVRHAEKAMTPGNDPALTAAGEQRARDLMTALTDARVTTVITTQFQRTQLTAKPLADSAKIAPMIVTAVADTKTHAEAVAAKAKSAPAGSVVLIVGHSNTIPAIINALGGPRVPEICDPEYSKLFVLEFAPSGPPRLIRGKYGVSDAPESDACARTMRQP